MLSTRRTRAAAALLFAMSLFARHSAAQDLEVLTAGPFPYNPRWRHSALEGAAQRALDLVAGLNWRLAGGRDS